MIFEVSKVLDQFFLIKYYDEICFVISLLDCFQRFFPLVCFIFIAFFSYTADCVSNNTQLNVVLNKLILPYYYLVRMIYFQFNLLFYFILKHGIT